MPIDTSAPYTDGWILEQLYSKLRKQQKHCAEMHDRYRGEPPMPELTLTQKQAVESFIKKARTNFERLIVHAVLARLKIRGIRTAVDPDEGGDAQAFQAWKRSRGKMWSKEVHKFALSMGVGFVMVGLDEREQLLVTAEDPRHVAILTDPADPLRVVASIKLIFDHVQNQDVAYLFRLDKDEQGNERVRMKIAKRSRAVSSPVAGRQFDAHAFDWSPLNSNGDSEVYDFEPEWLQETENRPAMLPVVPFVNEDGMAEFEPHIWLLDRITQQILDRMTIATIQAFKQRAIKGLPTTNPKTGEEIDYGNVFTAEPGAIWQLPAAAEIWESGEVNLQGILLSVRDDIKDLAAVSGTPLYTVTPDVANGSAEGASLQREQLTFKVEDRQDRWELPHERVDELIFRTLASISKDPKEGAEHLARSKPGTVEIMWAPGDRPSISERANGIAQTKGAMPIYMQLTDIWGMAPDQADRAMTMLQEDAARAAAFAAIPGGSPPPPPLTSQQQQQPGAARAEQQQPQAPTPTASRAAAPREQRQAPAPAAR